MLNREGLVNAVREKTGMGINESKAAMEAVVGAIEDAILTGQDVQLRGLGRFKIVTRAPRVCHVPTTGQTVKIESRRGVRFVLSKVLRDTLNG